MVAEHCAGQNQEEDSIRVVPGQDERRGFGSQEGGDDAEGVESVQQVSDDGSAQLAVRRRLANPVLLVGHLDVAGEG